MLDRARRVPAGRVTTYGDLSPGSPRYAGAVLFACHEPDVPWQRVVRADGSLAKGARQRRLLEAEGVPVPGRASGHARGLVRGVSRARARTADVASGLADHRPPFARGSPAPG